MAGTVKLSSQCDTILLSNSMSENVSRVPSILIGRDQDSSKVLSARKVERAVFGQLWYIHQASFHAGVLPVL